MTLKSENPTSPRGHRRRAGVALAVAGALIATWWVGDVRAEQSERAAAAEARCPSCAGYLGVSARSMTPELRAHFGAPADRGVLLSSVRPGSPAEAAGLAVGDVVTTIGGAALRSAGDLLRAVRGRPGEAVTIELYRDGAATVLEATLGQRPGVGVAGAGEEWQAWAESIAGMAEQLAGRFEGHGEKWAEHWAEHGAAWGDHWGHHGEAWGEHWGELGAEMGLLGADIGAAVAEALGDRDWPEVDRAEMEKALDAARRALEEIDWRAISEEMERAMEQVERELERSRAGGRSDDSDPR